MNQSARYISIGVAAGLLAIIFFWFFFSRSTNQEPARFLPADTVLLLDFPNVARTGQRWGQTALGKLSAEPEMRAFLEKPLARMEEKFQLLSTIHFLEVVKPSCAFVAVPHFTSDDVGVLIGLQFWGGRLMFDSGLERLRNELGELQEKSSFTHHDVVVQVSKHTAANVYSASIGRWGFIANREETIRLAIDYASGKADGAKLIDNPIFQKTAKQALTEADASLFLNAPRILDTLLQVGQSMGAQTDPSQIERLRKTEALGYSFKLDGPVMRDRFFVLRPNPPDVGNIDHEAIRFTLPNTTAYFDFLINFDTLERLVGTSSRASDEAYLGLSEVLGPECAIAAAWPGTPAKPSVWAMIELKDPAAAESKVQNLIANFFASTDVRSVDGIKLYGFPGLASGFANPTLAFHENHLLLGLDTESVLQAIENSKNPESLRNAPVFKNALPVYEAANEVFGFLNMADMVHHAYSVIRPILIFGAAVMPQIEEFVEVSKLPSAETLTKHLQPVVYAQKRTEDGYLMESSGPLTMNHLVALSLFAAGVQFWPAFSSMQP